MVKKYMKYIIAAVVGIIIAVCSWFFVVEPSYPYLLLDKDSPVIDDVTGIGYLPIEMTGASVNNAIVKHMCNVPEIYADYMHNVVQDKNSIMNKESFIGNIVLNYSWLIIIGLMMILSAYILFIRNKNRRKQK
jgi:LPXTG-motif cell wall-anchored protein